MSDADIQSLVIEFQTTASPERRRRIAQALRVLHGNRRAQSREAAAPSRPPRRAKPRPGPEPEVMAEEESYTARRVPTASRGQQQQLQYVRDIEGPQTTMSGEDWRDFARRVYTPMLEGLDTREPPPELPNDHLVESVRSPRGEPTWDVAGRRLVQQPLVPTPTGDGGGEDEQVGSEQDREADALVARAEAEQRVLDAVNTMRWEDSPYLDKYFRGEGQEGGDDYWAGGAAEKLLTGRPEGGYGSIDQLGPAGERMVQDVLNAGGR